MRVITGLAKGRRLKMPPGGQTRPAMDRVKASLFSILGGRVPGCRFLDLFAGSGSLGVEAISRGAAWATFVDKSPLCARTINENLEMTGFSDRSKVWCCDCVRFLKNSKDQPYDIVCIDPPYFKGLLDPVLDLVTDCGIFHDQTLFIVERQKRDDLHLGLRPQLVQTDERFFGTTILTFFQKGMR